MGLSTRKYNLFTIDGMQYQVIQNDIQVNTGQDEIFGVRFLMQK